MNLQQHSVTRQPCCKPWSLERLKEWHAWVISSSLEQAMTKAYASAFLSYTTFCERQNFSIQPTADTLSFYIVYMSHHIQPHSIKSYLSGICAELKMTWPEIWEICSSCIVTHTLAGCIKLLGQPAQCKCALSEQDLLTVLRSIPPSPSHDDLLFASIIFTGWHCLLHLGELVTPDNVCL